MSAAAARASHFPNTGTTPTAPSGNLAIVEAVGCCQHDMGTQGKLLGCGVAAWRRSRLFSSWRSLLVSSIIGGLGPRIGCYLCLQIAAIIPYCQLSQAVLVQLPAAYKDGLARQPLSGHTRRAYGVRAGQYLTYLEATPSEYGDPLRDPYARGHAGRDYRVYLKTTRKAKPTSVNLS